MNVNLKLLLTFNVVVDDLFLKENNQPEKDIRVPYHILKSSLSKVDVRELDSFITNFV